MSVRSSRIELVCRDCGYQFRSTVRGGNTRCPECGTFRYVRVNQEPEWTVGIDRPDAPPPGRPITCSCGWEWSTRARDSSGIRCPSCKRSIWIPAGGPRAPRSPQIGPAGPAPAGRPAPGREPATATRATRSIRKPQVSASETGIVPAATRTGAPRPGSAILEESRASRGTAPWSETLGITRLPGRPGRCEIRARGCTGSAVLRWSDPRAVDPAPLDTCDTCSATVAAAVRRSTRITRTLI